MMEGKRHLLIFPNPGRASRDTREPVPPPKIHKPGLDRQNARLSQQFRELERVFTAQRASLQSDPSGAMPEQILVLETVGSIENFVNAVKRIEGLEWMGELETEFEPDKDFFDEEKPEKTLGGYIYLVLSNQRALNSIKSLWEQYVANPQIQFPHGQNKWKQLFNQLRNIRTWDWMDRLRDTGVEDFWRDRLELGEERVRFEIELWYRQGEEEQQRSEQVLRRVIEELEGQVVSSVIIPEIAYHGVLAELHIAKIQNILQRVDVRLLKCEQVMFFRPMGQAAIILPDDEPVHEDDMIIQSESFQSETPVVALLDGLPLENHPYLAGRLVVDDPDGWSSEYQAGERKHGTAMASLIIHGDLNKKEPGSKNLTVFKKQPSGLPMTRISLLSDWICPPPGAGFCDRETSAPGVSPGQENCTKQAQGSSLR